jgi:AcrR family transcriptional regulator
VQTEPTRDRILDAARALFDAEGEAGLSMRRIAGAVGITPMAIYRHYADKEALKDALMLDGFAAWEARVAAIAVPGPLAWVRALGDAYLDFALSQPRRYEAAFLLKAGAARQFPRDIEAGRSPALRSAIARITQAQADGLLVPAPPVQVALHLAALMQGLVSMYRAGRFTDEAEFRAAYRAAVSHCLDSFRTETGP